MLHIQRNCTIIRLFKTRGTNRQFNQNETFGVNKNYISVATISSVECDVIKVRSKHSGTTHV